MNFVNNRLSKKNPAIFDDYFLFKATGYNLRVKDTLEVKKKTGHLSDLLLLRYKELYCGTNTD